MISIGPSGTLRGFVLALSLAVTSPVLATSTTTPVTGRMGPTQDGCPQAVSSTVVAGENCMYDGGPSSVPAAQPLPEGGVTGPYLQIAYYDSVETPAAFETTEVGLAQVLYVPTSGDQKMSQNITGSVTIDDGGDGFGAGDLISFELTLTSSGPGSIVRNYLSSTNSVVDKYDSMTQVLAPTAATSATANVSGGFDYVIGSEGFPTLRTFSQAGPCLGQILGFVKCEHTFATPPELTPSFWNETSAAGLGSLESNFGAKTTGTVENLQCINAVLPTGEDTNDCHDSVVSYAPWVNGPCQVKGGCTGTVNNPGAVRGAAEDVGWDQLLIKVSTDASGNVISVAGFNVDDYNAFGTTRCGDNTTGVGTYSANCNSWTSGYFCIPACGQETSSGIEISTVGVAPLGTKGTFTVPGGDPPSIVAISAQGTRGIATVDGKVITYTITDPTFFFGEDSYTYTLTDAAGAITSSIVTVTVPDVAPVLTDTFIVVGQGRTSKALAPDIIAGNGSPEQQTLVITEQGTQGVCEVSPANGTGKVIYTPNESSFVGNDACQLTLTDANGDTVSAPISITVTPKAKVGGAGSFDALSFLLLGFAPLLRRRSKRAERPRSLRATASAVAALAFLAGGVTASGQDVEDPPGETVETPAAPDSTAPEPAAEEKSTGRSAAAIDEIVVTSRKLEEKLLEVPLAITAFDSNAIESLGIRNLADVASLTPGLSFFNPTGESLPVPIIRGVVPTDIFGENNAAIFVDGVYISGREGLNFSQLDVERIEVVKGPQSALYGRNAFSGAINYITKKPSEEFEAKTNFTLGNRDQVVASGTVSGPIFGEKLRGRIAALYDDWDGSYNNAFPGGNDIGGHRYRSIQSSLLWLPAEAWTIDLNYYYSNDKIDDAAIVALPANCQDQVGDNNSTVRYTNFCGSIPDLVDIPGQNYYESIAKVPGATGENRDLNRGNLKVEWDLYEHGTISSLSGYSHTEQDSVIDFTRNLGENQVFLYCANALPGAPGVPNSCGSNPANQRFTTGLIDDEPGATTDETSQELRYTSSQDQRWRYTGGGYWFKTNRTSSAANNRGYTIATQPVPGGEPLGTGTVGLPPFDPTAPDFAIGTAIFYTTFTPDGGRDPFNRDKFQSDEEGWAIFTGSDFDINDQLTARAELRLSQNTVTVKDITYTACADKTDPACGDDVFDLRVRDNAPFLNADGECVINGQPAATVACSKKGSDRFESVTGRVGLDWQFTEEWMLYGSIAYGEKPGGVQLATARVIAEDGSLETRLITSSFEQEELTAYELGLKGTTWDGRLVVSTSVFYNDWKKIVLPQLILNDPGTGLPLEQPLRVSVNDADAGVLGFEIETDVGFTESFTGRFTLGWTDAELKSAVQDTYALFPDYAAEGFATDGGDVSGNTLLRQPEWLVSGSLAYQHQLFEEWDWYASGDMNYQSAIYVGNDNQSWIPSHTYVNTKLGVETGVYSIEAWTRNLFDQGKAVAAYRDIYFANTDNQYQPAVDQGPRPNFDDFVPWRYTVSYPNERTFGVTVRVRFGAAAE